MHICVWMPEGPFKQYTYLLKLVDDKRHSIHHHAFQPARAYCGRCGGGLHGPAAAAGRPTHRLRRSGVTSVMAADGDHPGPARRRLCTGLMAPVRPERQHGIPRVRRASESLKTRRLPFTFASFKNFVELKQRRTQRLFTPPITGVILMSISTTNIS